MAFTKIAAAGIGSTETVTLHSLEVLNNATVGGVLTYEDVTNVDSIGIITARAGVLVGSGITLSKDGDGFFTGVTTATKFVGDGSGLTGVASTDNIRTNTNATFLQNINVSGSTTTGSAKVGVDTGVYGENLVVTGNARVTGITTFGDSDNPASMLNIDATSGIPAISIPDSIIHSADTNTKIRFPSADTITAETGGSERLRIDSSGKILIGDNTAEGTIGLNAKVQTFGTDASTSSVAIRRGSNDAQAAFLVMSKSRNTSVGSRTILQNGDEVGNIFFAADDGTDLVSNTAAIKSQINGTPGANDTPGNLSFWTTSDGANSATQRMIIDSVGRVTKPHQFHIVVARSGNQSSYNPSQGFGTGVVYNTVVTTQGTDSSILDTSNGRITIPIDGIYFLEGSAYSDQAVFTQGWFTKNGSRLLYSDFMDNSGNSQNVNSVGFHKLAANDTIGFKAYGSSSTSTTVVASGNHTWLRITLVG